MNKENIYFKLKIPFATKSYINQSTKGLIIKGYAYYIFDKRINKFIKEYIELQQANFRVTDDKMKKPTEYYKTPLIKEIRTNYLDVYALTNNHKNGAYCVLDDNQIDNLNKEFKELDTTVLRMFSILSGSNPSGAETNHKNSPIKYIEGEYFNCNFINPLKLYRANAKQKQEIRNAINDIELKTYLLSDILEDYLLPGFKKVFDQYNKEWIFKDNHPSNIFTFEEKINDYKIKINDDDFILEDNQELFITAIKNKTLENYSEMIKNNKTKLKKKLRNFYKSNIYFKLKNNELPLHSTKQKIILELIDNAHIIKFSDLVNNGQYKDAINPYNCLRIDKNMHTLFDKNKIFFTKNGNIKDLHNKVVQTEYLDIENMPIQTLKFFNKIAKDD